MTTRYPRGDEPAPPAFRARALLDPDAIDKHDAATLAAGLPAGCPAGRPPAGACGSTAAAASAAGCASTASGGSAVTMDPGYELATQRAVSGSSSAAELAKPTSAARDAQRPVPPLAAHPPRRHGLGRRGRTGDRGAAEPVLRHAAPRVVLHREPAPRRRSAGDGPGRRARWRSRCAARTRRCPSRGSWSPPAPMPAAAASGPRRRSSAGSIGCSPVDVYIPGDPPSPIALLHGLLLAAGRVARGIRATRRLGGARRRGRRMSTLAVLMIVGSGGLALACGARRRARAAAGVAARRRGRARGFGRAGRGRRRGRVRRAAGVAAILLVRPRATAACRSTSSPACS